MSGGTPGFVRVGGGVLLLPHGAVDPGDTQVGVRTPGRLLTGPSWRNASIADEIARRQTSLRGVELKVRTDSRTPGPVRASLESELPFVGSGGRARESLDPDASVDLQQPVAATSSARRISTYAELTTLIRTIVDERLAATSEEAAQVAPEVDDLEAQGVPVAALELLGSISHAERELLQVAFARELAERWRAWKPESLPASVEAERRHWQAELQPELVRAFLMGVAFAVRHRLFAIDEEQPAAGATTPTVWLVDPDSEPRLGWRTPGRERERALSPAAIGLEVAAACGASSTYGELAWRALGAAVATEDVRAAGIHLPGLEVRWNETAERLELALVTPQEGDATNGAIDEATLEAVEERS